MTFLLALELRDMQPAHAGQRNMRGSELCTFRLLGAVQGVYNSVSAAPGDGITVQGAGDAASRNASLAGQIGLAPRIFI